jgi:hypothetical protein
MNPTSRHLSMALACAGALPFWLFMFAPETVAGLNSVSLFVSYGAIIASFMAGTLWGQAQGSKSDLFMIMASNALALISFATIAFTTSLITLLVQMVLFWLLLAADYRIYARDIERRWYWRLRLWVTVAVTLAYDIMLLDDVLAACVWRS